ncbi:hypothetical protein J6590_040789 [Homalodisca vitripennis]|nr:hypothetical protein J6590_040789 [Homalodisca vitripennis]
MDSLTVDNRTVSKHINNTKVRQEVTLAHGRSRIGRVAGERNLARPAVNGKDITFPNTMVYTRYLLFSLETAKPDGYYTKGDLLSRRKHLGDGISTIDSML